MLKEVHSAYQANRIILGADGAAGQAFLSQHAEFIKEMKPMGGKATAYVCQNYACQQPTADLAELRRQLTASRPAPQPGRQTGSAFPKTEPPTPTPAPSPAPR